MNDKLYDLAVCQLPGVGNVVVRHLVNNIGSSEEVFNASKARLKALPNVGAKLVNLLSNAKVKDEALAKASQYLEEADKEGARIITFNDEAYPYRMRECNDAPNYFYLKGDAMDFNVRYAVAIVGTRKSTAYGKNMTETIIEELAPLKPLIISGLAYGIDIEAHQAALAYGLPTIGVMATGIEAVYPARHRDIAEQMVKQGGGLMTENPVGSNADGRKFPARNRMIAGMADCTIVVEALAKGGALITANLAQSYHREVFAVPGTVGDLSSEGCNNYIKDSKAQLITSGLDVIKFMNWDNGGYQKVEKKKPKSLPPVHLNAEERKVFYLLQKNGELHIDDLSFKSDIPMNLLAGILLNLEFQNIVKACAGKKFKLL